MTVHLVKLCVGADTVEDLDDWVARRTADNKARGWGKVHDHVTRMFPRRRDEILDGGSIYWVIKGLILVRQRIVDLKPVVGADGIERCAILLDPPLIPTQAYPRKAFQGWRYLSADDAPPDFKTTSKGRTKAGQKGAKQGAQRGEGGDERSQAALRAELAELGLL